MRVACRTTKARITYWFFTATMVTRTRPNVTLLANDWADQRSYFVQSFCIHKYNTQVFIKSV